MLMTMMMIMMTMNMQRKVTITQMKMINENNESAMETFIYKKWHRQNKNLFLQFVLPLSGGIHLEANRNFNSLTPNIYKSLYTSQDLLEERYFVTSFSKYKKASLIVFFYWRCNTKYDSIEIVKSLVVLHLQEKVVLRQKYPEWQFYYHQNHKDYSAN